MGIDPARQQVLLSDGEVGAERTHPQKPGSLLGSPADAEHRAAAGCAVRLSFSGFLRPGFGCRKAVPPNPGFVWLEKGFGMKAAGSSVCLGSSGRGGSGLTEGSTLI